MKLYRLATVFSLTFGLWACGPAKRPRNATDNVFFSQNGERLTISHFNVVLPASLGGPIQNDPVNEALKIKLIAAIRAHAEAFDQNEGMSLPGDIAVTDSSDLTALLEPADPNAPVAHTTGVYLHPNAIVVWTGGNYDVPALYHELCHLNFAPFDAEHKDDRWSLWDERGMEVVRKLQR